MKKLITGFYAYFAGIRNGFTHGDLLRLTVIPFFLDCICLIATLYFSYSHLSDIVTYVLHKPETLFQDFLYYVLYLVTGIGLLFISILLAMIFANLISFPFNDMLAEKSLLHERALVLSERTFKLRMRKSFRNLSAMLKKTVLLLAFVAVIALLSLIPGLAILGAAFSVFILAWDRLDYSFDQFEFTLGQRIDFIRKYFAEIVGFSAGLGLVMAIPVVNILLLPASVVAGAHLVANLRKITQE